MDDLISRQAAIDAIEHNAYRHTYIDQIVDIIKALPSAQPHWVPFSERWPEIYATVLVMFCDGNMKILTFPNNYRALERVAWMPLPEPYKEV